nr:hypothetical protein B0A51_11497 [Rachicladosporium sp. CCFEE 5018]
MADQSATNPGSILAGHDAPKLSKEQKRFQELCSHSGAGGDILRDNSIRPDRQNVALPRPTEGNTGLSSDNGSTEQQAAGQDATVAPAIVPRKAKPTIESDSADADKGKKTSNARATPAESDKPSRDAAEEASVEGRGRKRGKKIKVEEGDQAVEDDCGPGETYIFVRGCKLKVTIQDDFDNVLGSKLPSVQDYSNKDKFEFNMADKNNFGMPSPKILTGKGKGQEQYYSSKGLAIILGLGYDDSNKGFSKNKMRQLPQFDQYNGIKPGKYIPWGNAAVVKDTRGNYYYLSYAGQLALWGTEGMVGKDGKKTVYRNFRHMKNMRNVDDMQAHPGATPLMLINSPRPDRRGWSLVYRSS